MGPLAIFAKSTILDTWKGSEYTSEETPGMLSFFNKVEEHALNLDADAITSAFFWIFQLPSEYFFL